MRIPLSTYRLQFGRDFRFCDARRLVPYLHKLGITDVYASPIFRCRSETSSGYDVVDPTSLNPACGTMEDLIALSLELKRHDMGLVLDIVPNHMAAHTSNPWWRDVLENGSSSPYAYYFDIEWDPPTRWRTEKLVWPILGSPYAEVLENRQLTLAFSEEGFALQYFDRSLPIEPSTYGAILFLQAGDTSRAEVPQGDLEEITALERLIRELPPTTTTNPAEIDRRYRQKEELKRRLWALYATNDRFHEALDQNMRTLNGEAGDPRSFDRLDDLLTQQPYQLSFWRVSRERMNYRRFFDITDLVGINVEEPEVFAATHALVFQLVDDGWVTGLRIDHIDGLYDPAEYLRLLRERLPDCYLIVEKILETNEVLPREWPVAGTTGYDFIAAVNSVMVPPRGLDRLSAIYAHNTGAPSCFADVVYEQKKRIIEELFSGEALSLSLHLNLLAEQDRYAKDASPHGLYTALLEVTACLPVYRTYTRSFQIRPPDLAFIEHAVQEARRRNPQLGEPIWGFFRRVLLLQCPPSLPPQQRARWKQFVQRWQQFSGPVMAKGLEDTAFYIYNRLVSMNEVGGLENPWSLEEFHRFAGSRAKCWPHTLNAGTTHDTKRGEDVRTRIHTLAEIPEVWERSLQRWRRWNARCKPVLNGAPVPGPNEELFIYQTLLGAWPLDPAEEEPFQQRLQAALIKSWREAKVHTSWATPNEAYESAVASFVSTVLAPSAENRFLPDFLRVQQRIASHGAFRSLSQTLLRIVAPGVPDIYQGSELWELSLVDPDNRRPVDFEKRQALLVEAETHDVGALLDRWQTGAVKQFLIQKTLACRREYPEIFRNGEYIPLLAAGAEADRVFACARHAGMSWVIAVAPRFTVGPRWTGAPLGRRVWSDTELTFPPNVPRHWTNLFTAEHLEVPEPSHTPVAALLRRFPVALLLALPD